MDFPSPSLRAKENSLELDYKKSHIFKHGEYITLVLQNATLYKFSKLATPRLDRGAYGTYCGYEEELPGLNTGAVLAAAIAGSAG